MNVDITGFKGLHTKLDISSFKQDEYGLVWLASCSNVDISDNYHVSVRPGSTIAVKDDASSWSPVYNSFSHPSIEFALIVEGDKLYAVRPNLSDISLIELADVTGSAKMSFSFHDDKIYYCNGFEKGYVDVLSLTNNDWEMVGEYTLTNHAVYDPPLGYLIHFAFGRMWMAYENYVYGSLSHDPSKYFMRYNHFIMDGMPTMINSTKDHMFISDRSGIYAYNGDESFEKRVFGSQVVLGTDILINPDEIGLGDTEIDEGIICLTRSGVVFISNNMVIKQLTKQRIDIPELSNLIGSAVIVNGKYICQCNVK